MRLRFATLMIAIFLSAGLLPAQQSYAPPPQPPIPAKWKDSIPRAPWTMPLYEGAIPNATQAPDEEKTESLFGFPFIEKISKPTITAYLPSTDKSVGSSVVIFPGGGYVGEALSLICSEVAESLQNRGVAAFVVKYRLPSGVTMRNQSIGPLQDAQQAIRLVREHAKGWNLNPGRVGVMGASAGGHLASTAGTHFSQDYIPNEDKVNLRPDFMILVSPVISMMSGISEKVWREALMGANPPDALARSFSSDMQVTAETPPTLILDAADDTVVDVDHSVRFFEALRHHKVPVDMIIFAKGDHGFFLIIRDQWLQPIFAWMTRNSWMKP